MTAPTRRQLALDRALAQQVANTRVTAASTKAAINADIAAVSDTVPPNLAAKLAQLDDLTDRVANIENG